MRNSPLLTFAFMLITSLLPACGGSGDAGTIPQGTFACGSETCDLATQACVATAIDGTSPPDTSSACKALSEACLTDHSCACWEKQEMGNGASNQCTEGSDGSINGTELLP